MTGYDVLLTVALGLVGVAGAAVVLLWCMTAAARMLGAEITHRDGRVLRLWVAFVDVSAVILGVVVAGLMMRSVLHV